MLSLETPFSAQAGTFKEHMNAAPKMQSQFRLVRTGIPTVGCDYSGMVRVHGLRTVKCNWGESADAGRKLTNVRRAWPATLRHFRHFFSVSAALGPSAAGRRPAEGRGQAVPCVRMISPAAASVGCSLRANRREHAVAAHSG